MMTKLVQGATTGRFISYFLFNDKFTVELPTLECAALSAMVGFQVSDSWFINTHDMETTRLLTIQDHMRYFFDTKYSTDTTELHHLDSLI
jgi:hypothetical protein